MALLLLLLPQPVTGVITVSILLILLATLILPLKLSVLCVFLMVLLPFFVRLAVLSRSLRQYGGRLISIVFPGLHLLIRWTVSVLTFSAALQMIKDRLKANPLPIQLPVGKEENFQGCY